MELPFLPNEIIYKIIYTHGGLIHPHAIIMKEFIKENEMFKSEVFQEPNFYEFLKLCRILNSIYPYILIHDLHTDTYYPYDYYYDSDLENEDYDYENED